MFLNKSPSNSTVEENAATLFCCKKLQKCFVDYNVLFAHGWEDDWIFMFGWTYPLKEEPAPHRKSYLAISP